MEFQPLDHQGSPLVLFLRGSVSTELFLLHTYIFLNFYFEVTSFIGSCKNSRERPLFQFPLWFPSITRGLSQRQANNSGATCARRALGPSVPRVTTTARETLLHRCEDLPYRHLRGILTAFLLGRPNS